MTFLQILKTQHVSHYVVRNNLAPNRLFVHRSYDNALTSRDEHRSKK